MRVFRLRRGVLPFLACTVFCACSDMFGGPVPMPDGSADGGDSQDPGSDPAETDGPSCGNGVVENGEACDDGNAVDADGCDADCTFSCMDFSDCTDGDLCNGRETCDAGTHACSPGMPEPDGFVCIADPRGICLDGVCGESFCGDGFVDDGKGEFCEPLLDPACMDDCTFVCRSAADCPDNGEPCDGTEICDEAAGRCARRDPLPDGSRCGDDAAGLICIARSCQGSVCGDGFVDTSAVPPEECEDGNTVGGDGCELDCRYTCHEESQAQDCDDGRVCTADTCQVRETHTCLNTPIRSNDPCRPAAQPCDEDELCNGLSPDCPEDAMAPEGYPCEDGDSCTMLDMCSADGVCAGTPDPGCCSEECALPGSTRCSGDVQQVCGNYDSDTCREWGADDLCSDCSCGCGDYGTRDEIRYCLDGKDNDCDGTADAMDCDCDACGDDVCSCGETPATCPADCADPCTMDPTALATEAGCLGAGCQWMELTRGCCSDGLTTCGLPDNGPYRCSIKAGPVMRFDGEYCECLRCDCSWCCCT